MSKTFHMKGSRKMGVDWDFAGDTKWSTSLWKKKCVSACDSSEKMSLPSWVVRQPDTSSLFRARHISPLRSDELAQLGEWDLQTGNSFRTAHAPGVGEPT